MKMSNEELIHNFANRRARLGGRNKGLDDPYGKEILKKEREFNKKAGFTNLDDRLPEFFKTEPLPPHNVVFDVPDEELDAVFKDM